MLATHNTMSYLPFESFWYRLKWWIYRCQNRTIDEQIKDGVRYFDIRVKRIDPINWVFAHAGVNFISKESVKDILKKICENDCYFRLIYEGSSEYGKEYFKTVFVHEISELCGNNLDQVVIKEGWIEIKPSRFKFIDRSLVLNHSDNKDNSYKIKIKRFTTSIKCWAKKHNVKISEEELKDNKVVYFYDFYNI